MKLISSTLLFCLLGSLQASAQNEILVGDIMTYSGPAASLTDTFKTGMLIAVKEFNDAGGLNGAKVRVFSKDDKLDPTEAKKAALSHILEGKVDFLIGGIDAVVCDAISQVAKDKKVPYVAAFCMSEFLNTEKLHRYIVHGHTTARAEYSILTKVAMDAFPSVNNWTLIGPNTHFGRENVGIFKDTLKAAGKNVVKETYSQLFAPDMTAYITSMMAGKPEGVLSSLWGPDAVTFTKQAASFGAFKTAKYVANDIGLHPVYDGLGKAHVDGSIGLVFPFGNESSSIPDWKGMQEWVKKYAEMSNITAGPSAPTYAAIWGYESMKTALELMKKAGTKDREKFADTFTTDFNYNTPWGKVDYRGCDQQAYHPVYVGTIRNDDKGFRMTDVKRFAGKDYALSCDEVKKRASSKSKKK